MDTKHTQGEWEATNGDSIKSDDGLIAIITSRYDSDQIKVREDGESWLDMRHRTEPMRIEADKERKANAKLIAAAPELLEAVERAKNRLEELMNHKEWSLAPFGSVWSTYEKLVEAIKKATS